MVIYTLRNDKSEYVSMSGGLTTDWLEASKFREESLETRLKYTSDNFKPKKFKVEEID